MRFLHRGLVILLLINAVSLTFASLQLVNIAGVILPTTVVQPPNDSSRLFIVGSRWANGNANTGKIWLKKNGNLTAFLTRTGLASSNGEQGLLGLVFDPDFANNGVFYTYMVLLNWDVVIAKYHVMPGNPDVADPASEDIIFRLPEPYNNHNGGMLKFGEDGYLYAGVGDGGSGYDPENRAQNKNVLWGKMIRIDPHGDDFPVDPDRDYRIPPGNPMVSTGAPEIWAYGLRNPWTYSFDARQTNGFGGLSICDVGQDNIEEIDYANPGTKGQNYGWRQYEGNSDTGIGGGDGGPYKFPIYTYSHADGCAITGGVNYRGTRLGAQYWSKFFFSDYCTAFLHFLDYQFDLEDGSLSNAPYAGAIDTGITGDFGVGAIVPDNDGELYLVHTNTHTIYKIVETNPSLQATGTLTFQDLAGNGPLGVIMEFRNPTTHAIINSLQVGIPDSGAFKVPIPTGAFELSVKSATWLRQTMTLNSTSGDLSGVTFSLINGDCDGDNEIGPGDFGVLSSSYGSVVGESGYAQNADLDRDGEVGPSDFGILSSNYGLTGDE